MIIRKSLFAVLMLMVSVSVLFAGEKAVKSKAEKNQYINGTIFKDITKESGFLCRSSGKCIAMADANNDGLLDIFITTLYGGRKISGYKHDCNKLYINQGNMRFKDTASLWGMDLQRPVSQYFPKGCAFDGFAAVWADFNNDGKLDLYVTCGTEGKVGWAKLEYLYQPNHFFLGDKDGFRECAGKAGLRGSYLNASCSIATADVNGDGLLDIYVGKGSAYFHPRFVANSLYVNNGDGTYRDIAEKAGVTNSNFSFNSSFCDYDNDGDPDLFVGNLHGTLEPIGYVLYRNNGDGTFSDVSKKVGINIPGECNSCFWGDIDNDGDQDLFLGWSGHPDILMKNNGDGTFSDVSIEAGIAYTSRTRGCVMGDIDNDGDLDIIVTNCGSLRSDNFLRSYSFIYLNDGTGKFTDGGKTTGGCSFWGHGCVLGDLDNDGDLDLTVGNWYSSKTDWFLFMNKTDNKNFIKVNLEGTKSNRSAVMSKIWVYDAAGVKDKKVLRGYREVTAGNNVFCTNPLEQHFGVSADKRYDIVVRFPSGIERILKNVKAGKTYDIREED